MTDQGVPQKNFRYFSCAKLFVVIFLVIHVLLLGYSATRHSPTALEGPLLMAGVSHWKLGRYELYRVNPPLVRMIAAIPVVLVGCKTDWTRFIDGPRVRPEYGMGSQFIKLNGERSLWLITLARWACIPFSLIGGLYCFLWARELYQRDVAGLIALTLWCFDPLILGNSELITNDTAATSFGIVAGYYFWHWLKSPPTWTRCGIAGGALALAILAKTTWIFLFLLWPILALSWFILKYKNREIFARTSSIVAQLGVIFIVAVWSINIFYGFDGSFENLGSYSFVSKKLSSLPHKSPYLASIPVPLPKQFVLGLDTQFGDLEDYATPAYLRGQWREDGWWYYYVYGLLVKWPHGTQILFLLAVLLTVFWKATSPSLDELILIVPGLTLLLIVSSQVEINMHFRYVLPFVGLAFVFIGKVACLAEKSGWGRIFVVLLLLFSALSTLANYPHSLAYFNEFSGGPANGHKHLLHSAIDWGQDLKYLKKWLNEHPEVKLDGLAYYGGFDASSVGIDCPRPPVGHFRDGIMNAEDAETIGPVAGWYALSTNSLWAPSHEYEYFLQFQPYALVGRTICIYHITID